MSSGSSEFENLRVSFQISPLSDPGKTKFSVLGVQEAIFAH